MSRYQPQTQQPTHAQLQSHHQNPVRRKPNNGFGEDVDEAGGIGDEMDSISLRDVSTVRYVRHHEWMELVLGSAVNTNKILPTKVIPDSSTEKEGSPSLWHFDDAKSLQDRIEELTKENDKLEEENKQGIKKSEQEEFYKKAILKLREEFGDPNTTVDTDEIKELENRFPGHSVIEKKRVRRVVGDLNLPEPQKKDPNFEPPKPTVVEPEIPEVNDQMAELGDSQKPEDQSNQPQPQPEQENQQESQPGNMEQQVSPGNDLGDITMENNGGEADAALAGLNDGDTAMEDLSDVLNM